MDEIEIQCDWSKIPRQKYSNLLAKRFYGWLPQILIPVTGVMTAFLVILVLRAIVNPTDLPASWAVAFVPFYLGYIVAKLMNDYWKRRLLKALGSAEIRRQGQSIFYQNTAFPFQDLTITTLLAGLSLRKWLRLKIQPFC